MNPVEYDRMFEAEERQWWYAGMRELSSAVAAGALAPAGGRFLDAGCGSGRNLAWLSQWGRAVGIDLSPDALRLTRQRGGAAVRGSVLDLPFPDATFDVVTSFDVIYHRWVTDDRAAVRELARVLKPGGHLLVRVPALRALWGAHDEAVHSRHRYTVPELRELARECGLAVVRTTYANSLLLPLLLVRRTLDRLLDRHGSDVGFLPPPLERLFRGALATEATLVRAGWSLPVGASAFLLARREPG